VVIVLLAVLLLAVAADISVAFYQCWQAGRLPTLMQ
jgi:hypothetical protein